MARDPTSRASMSSRAGETSTIGKNCARYETKRSAADDAAAMRDSHASQPI
jgi:hypothetical protein